MRQISILIQKLTSVFTLKLIIFSRFKEPNLIWIEAFSEVNPSSKTIHCVCTVPIENKPHTSHKRLIFKLKHKSHTFPWQLSYGAETNAICLSLAESAKANCIDFYKYLVKLRLIQATCKK